KTVSSGTTGSVTAQLITHDWKAGTDTGGVPSSPPVVGATWITYDGTTAWPASSYTPTPVASGPSFFSYAINTWDGWDITGAVIAWMSGAYPNYGIWLVPVPAVGGPLKDTRYQSSESTATYIDPYTGNSVSERPALWVNYLLPCGAVAPATTHTVTLPAGN